MKSAKVRLSGGSHAATRLTPRRYRGRTLNRDEPLPPGPPPPLSAEGSSPLRSPPAAATASVPATASVLVSALALAPGLAPGQAWAACESAFALFWIFMYFGPQRANRELAGCHKGKGKHEDRKGKTLSTVHWRSPRCFCTSHVHVKLGGGARRMMPVFVCAHSGNKTPAHTFKTTSPVHLQMREQKRPLA